MIAYEENKSVLYNANQNIKRLKIKITQFQNKKSKSDGEINLE